jgi:hypothetical protein
MQPLGGTLPAMDAGTRPPPYRRVPLSTARMIIDQRQGHDEGKMARPLR